MAFTENLDTFLADFGNAVVSGGVSYKGIDYAKSNDFSLIVCLDCGVKAIEKVAYAKNKDIDLNP